MEGLQLTLLNTGYSVHRGDWNWQEISSPFTRIYYVKEGTARIHLQYFTQELKPHNLYMIPPFTLHSYECNDYFSHFYIHIYENPKGKLNRLEEFNFPTEIKAKSLDLQLIHRLLEINPNRELKQYDPRAYDNQTTLLKNIAEETQQAEYAVLETKGILTQLLSRFFKYASPKSEVQDERIQRVLNYIRKNLNSQIMIRELAERCNLSDDHFIRLFKKEMNCTPIRYINQKKIEKVQLMLLTENTPIKDIAYSLSFENISYFNKVFKQVTGYTPSKYYNTIKSH
ncbi:AraC family transcriptional regulator [Bacteroidales bacterium OttesenSCG-928-A17]|nr:AraC family transcriptional regulator [Bacteroidales bacterium OttesenSCG-928-A17]